MEQRGVEPLTSALRTRRSAKLSYCPTRLSKILGSVVEGVKLVDSVVSVPPIREFCLLCSLSSKTREFVDIKLVVRLCRAPFGTPQAFVRS